MPLRAIWPLSPYNLPTSAHTQHVGPSRKSFELETGCSINHHAENNHFQQLILGE
jgi:hypothetical protein